MAEPKLILGDCIEEMQKLPAESVDAIVCDPPYGLNFMGKEWDSFHREIPAGVAVSDTGVDFKAGATGVAHSHGLAGHDGQAFQNWCLRWATEAMRVLKPGGHLVVFGGTRTFHRLMCAIEDAGFEIRDCMQWLYAQGMPKGRNIGKALDKAGARLDLDSEEFEVTTETAKRWDGWNTTLKPAYEPIPLARKPLGERTVEKNVLKHGTGAINVDACRVGISGARNNGRTVDSDIYGKMGPIEAVDYGKGRWPANVLISHSDGCVEIGTTKVKAITGGFKPGSTGAFGQNATYGEAAGQTTKPEYGDADGTETVELWECVEDCPVRLLDEQSGITKSSGGEPLEGEVNRYGVYGSRHRPRTGKPVGKGDVGGASRFFYQPKASKREKNAGLEPKLKLREDLTEDERRFVLAELERLGVKL